jgi:hypothetical protein
MADGISMKPADGVIMMSPEMAPMKHESKLHLPTSIYVYSIHVSAPLAAQRLVTQSAIMALKFSDKAVPASKASHEPQILIRASS